MLCRLVNETEVGRVRGPRILVYASLGTFSRRFALETSLSPRAFQRHMRGFGTVPQRLAALYVPACYLARWNVPHNVHLEEVSAVGEGRRVQE
jgi:hypothetical protein